MIKRSSHQLGSSLHAPYSTVYYIIEGKDWAIAWDGKYIAHHVRNLAGVRCVTTRSYQGIINQVVHFGSRNVYLSGGIDQIHDSNNKVVLYWTHGDKSDAKAEMRHMIDRLSEAVHRVHKIVTCSTIGQERLISWGVPESQIAMIPIGVDLSIFRPSVPAQRQQMRERLGIPDDTICVGSFQKDGEGWGEGDEPKLVKGPDIFLTAIEKLAAKHKLYVLLTGPARGYVKRGLDRLGVAYHHTFLQRYHDVVPYYHCLDMYLVTSRDEGGPKAILEGMATGVPIVSTRVGMASDVLQDGENGFIVDVEDTEGLATAASKLIDSPDLRYKFAQNGLTSAAEHDWSVTAMRYYNQIWKPLLSN